MNDELDNELDELKQLKVEAPQDTIQRLKKRLRVAQIGKDLIERQAWAFWVVLDTFLRLLFGIKRKPESATVQSDKPASTATQQVSDHY